MRKVIVLLLLLSFTWLQGAEDDFTTQVSLEKDQFQTLVVHEEKILHVLKFRWTLYANDGLVMHLNYDDRVSQFILYNQYKKATYKVRLLPKKTLSKQAAFLYLTFNKFDYKEKKAYFDILVNDPEEQALIEVKEK